MKKAFTLIELMVIVAIIGLMSAVLLPAVQMIRGEREKRKGGHSEVRAVETRAPEYITIDGKRYRLIQE